MTSLQLYLMRHGEALSRQEAGVGTDAERPLAPQGIETVNRVAQGLKALGIKPDRVLTSALVRAQQTAELVASHLGCAGRVEACQALLPEHDPSAFLDALREIHACLPRPLENREAGRRQADEVILAVGHQPYLGRLAAQLVFGEPHDGLALSPAGLCLIEFPEFPRKGAWPPRGFTPRSLEATLSGLWGPELFSRPTRR